MFGKLTGQLIKQEFAPCKLKILLIHAVATLESSHNHGGWALKESHSRVHLHGIGLILCSFTLHSWQDSSLRPIFIVQNTVGCTHASNDWPTIFGWHDPWSEAGGALLSCQDLGWWDHYVLWLVVLCGTFAFVLSFLSCSIFVRFLKVRINIFCNPIDLFLQRGQALDPI